MELPHVSAWYAAFFYFQQDRLDCVNIKKLSPTLLPFHSTPVIPFPGDPVRESSSECGSGGPRSQFFLRHRFEDLRGVFKDLRDLADVFKDLKSLKTPARARKSLKTSRKSSKALNASAKSLKTSAEYFDKMLTK